MKGKKTGGRIKGTPNKLPSVKKEYIATLLGEYFDSDLMHKDFLSLEAKDRLYIAEKFMKFVIPSMQATSVDLSVQNDGETLTDRLRLLSDTDEQ